MSGTLKTTSKIIPLNQGAFITPLTIMKGNTIKNK